MSIVRNVLRALSLWIALTGFWFLYTLDLSLPSMLLGSIASIIVTCFTYRLFFGLPGNAERYIIRWDMILIYFLFLIIQSYLGSFSVIVRMLQRNNKPGVVRISTRLHSSMGRILLANTISLIPGTLTLWLDDNHLYVHLFNVKSTHRIRAGREIKEPMEGFLQKIFG